MLKSFFAVKKWVLWAYSGLFLLLAFLYVQTSLNVAINEWYKDFYDLLQKPKIERLQGVDGRENLQNFTENSQDFAAENNQNSQKTAENSRNFAENSQSPAAQNRAENSQNLSQNSQENSRNSQIDLQNDAEKNDKNSQILQNSKSQENQANSVNFSQNSQKNSPNSKSQNAQSSAKNSQISNENSQTLTQNSRPQNTEKTTAQTQTNAIQKTPQTQAQNSQPPENSQPTNSKKQQQLKKAQAQLENANFLNKMSLVFYQFLLESFFDTPSISGEESYTIGDFYALIGVFLAIAIPYVIIATLNIYFASVYAFKWREAMTFEYLAFWKRKDDNIEGSSQRIQEDIYNFSKIVESLGLAFVRAMMTLVAFIPILWALSESISKSLFAGLSEDSFWFFLSKIDGLLVYVALFISLGGLIISWFVGIKLPGLEYNNQKAEAAFRKELVFAEDDRKNYASPQSIFELFTGLKINYRRLFLHYGYFNIWLILFEQMIVIVPFLIVAPSLFAGVITLGIVMQMNNAFSQVRSSFSVFITNWTRITELRSIHKRLREFEKNIDYR